VADFVKLQVGEAPVEVDDAGPRVVLFETAESDLVSLHGGRSDVRELGEDAAGRLVAIADAAEHVYRSVAGRLRPDRVELQLSVGLSGEVGWFVAKSAASGGMKLTLSWDSSPAAATSDEPVSGGGDSAGAPGP
jgi:hypothetical protein